ncbi:hypothetical protein [Pseudomonas sp. 7-41]|uniref:hypothetical protein n=1 Tax=Pseudomonas sp. 7-41 TaxID=2898483 RepID=UPI001E3926CA|nr:hypothetical protein [Pseudomonas sp. 7-41]UHG99179.1 hypothetical protein LQ249_06860 [Pseudomonas sp. 7-41]
MQSIDNPQATRNSIAGTAFAFGLFLIVAAGVTLVFDWAHAGLLFCTGMAVCLVTGIVSALMGEKTSRGEMITLVIGAAFFLWLIIHNL